MSIESDLESALANLHAAHEDGKELRAQLQAAETEIGELRKQVADFQQSQQIGEAAEIETLRKQLAECQTSLAANVRTHTAELAKRDADARRVRNTLLSRLAAIPGQPEHAETAARMKAERIAALESELAAIKGPS